VERSFILDFPITPPRIKAKKQQMNNKEFISTLIKVFPEIEDDVLDEDNNGLITLQISFFRKFTQNAVDNNDLLSIKKCFQFVDDMIGNVEDRVESALYLSFLNKLSFVRNPGAEKLLSNKLLGARSEINDYENSKSNNVKLNEFLDDL